LPRQAYLRVHVSIMERLSGQAKLILHRAKQGTDHGLVVLVRSLAIEIYANGVYHPKMEFIETPIFTRMVMALLADDEYRELQTELMENPERGDLIKGGGGIRKM
jgi:hypothetical protein